LVGWINTARYKWAEIMGREIKFKPATFYLGIADHLAKAVEGLSPAAHRDQDKDQLERREEPEPAETIHVQEENVFRSKHEGNGQELEQPAASERTDGEDDQDYSTAGKS
jgi:triacylglycerol lipase